MKIDLDKCSGCKLCVNICTVSAISMGEKNKASIDRDTCVECGVCKRVEICPKEAIIQEDLHWPRSVRRLYSDPTEVFVETGVDGRGTEEMKTNELTHRYQLGEVGIALDVGRPNVGTSFKDVETITKALASKGIELEKSNPLAGLMSNLKTGEFKKDVRGERVLSTIVEFKIPAPNLLEILELLKEVGQGIDTVFSVGVISVTAEKQAMNCFHLLKQNGWPVKPNGKVNLGLGRAD